ncbi:MAG: diguanylate cyclase [Gammaproteobacteria bacterium]
MPTEQEWRDKYRDVLSRLAAEEARWTKTQNVLKLLIGRLTLAAQGRDDRLDHELARVAEVTRKQIDVDSLDGLIAPLSAAVAALDSADSANTQTSTGSRRKPANTEKPEKPERQENASRGAAGSATGSSPGLESAASRRVEASAGGAVSSLTGAPIPATDEGFGATAVLDRLALLPELKPVVGELRSRKHDTLDIHELADLLERVTRFATEQRAQVQKEKLELENIVQQLAARLEEISLHLTSELADRSAGQDDCEQLSTRVTDEVKQLRLTAESVTEIASLRQQLAARLDAISDHFTAFRSREETRVRTYRDRVTRMRTRIAVLERESRTLHENLREEQRMGMIDALTGIPNRAAYDDRIEEEYKRWKRFARPVSILAWDIDRFKTINDAYGHKAGDKVLRVIGQHLARHVRDTDFVGRYGGEEFVMLLVGTDTSEAKVVAEKIRQEISQLGFHFHDHPVAITACCGITGFTGDDTPDAAFDRADKALYRAKEAGRNCCIIG